MKIAISSTGKTLESSIADVFARCPYFFITEIKNRKIENFEAIKNEAGNRIGGAGIFAAKLMAEKNIDVVITKNIGPRAFEILKQFNILVYQGQGVVKEVLEKFIEGKLEKFEK